jgi:hypothetical protein
MSRDAAQVASRLRLALEFFSAGESMMRAKLTRESPGSTESEIEARLQQWLADRPGAEYGDAVGRPVPWPRSAG